MELREYRSPYEHVRNIFQCLQDDFYGLRKHQLSHAEAGASALQNSNGGNINDKAQFYDVCLSELAN